MIKKLCAADVRVTIAIGKKEEKLEEETKKLLKTLIEWGVRIHCNDLIHAKVVLAEGEVKKALVMSSNVTTQGLHTNYEIGVCFPITKQIILERLRDYTSSIIGSEQTKGVDCNDVV
jgi:phosphatidylserine/phosphatidylglycerophosphate/cardiolipin synthase-like enzyme